MAPENGIPDALAGRVHDGGQAEKYQTLVGKIDFIVFCCKGHVRRCPERFVRKAQDAPPARSKPLIGLGKVLLKLFIYWLQLALTG